MDQALLQAVEAHKSGKLQVAEQLYRAILQAQPKQPDANHNLGVLAVGIGKPEAALPFLKVALEANPKQWQFWISYVNALIDAKQLVQATNTLSQGKLLGLTGDPVTQLEQKLEKLVDESQPKPSQETYQEKNQTALKEILPETNTYPTHRPPKGPSQQELDNLLSTYTTGNFEVAEHLANALTQEFPNHSFGWKILGAITAQTGRLQDSLVPMRLAIQLEPNDAGAHNNLGNVLKDLARLSEAESSYRESLRLKPDLAEAHSNLGNVLKDLARLSEAESSYREAIRFKPDFAEAHSNLGNTVCELGRLTEAEAIYREAIRLKPDFAGVHNNIGKALKDLGRLSEAESSYREAIRLKPDFSEAHSNLGNTVCELGRLTEAETSYREAIRFKPNFAEAHNNLGNALKALGRLSEAESSYREAIRLKPGFSEAHSNLGNTVRELGRLTQAEASYREAIRLRPSLAEAHSNLGSVLFDLKRLDEALASFDTALSLNPDCEFVSGMKIHTRMKLCIWTDLAEALLQLELDIIQEKKVSEPFPFEGLIDKPHLQLLASKIYVGAKYPVSQFTKPFNRRESTEKIRVGYYSADFHNHATTHLIAELFEAHDRSKFEIYGFSFGPNSTDEMRQRISAGLEHFYDVRSKSDGEIVQISRDIGIDIAIDLKGFTKDARTGIFAEGCAPIQVNYLGYPGSMGASYIDYIIADKTVIPESHQIHFTEKVVYLPNCYLVNDSKRKISDKVFTRQEVGLPEFGFVFCCFNNNYKILPATFDSWMRILKTINGSVLWLLEDHPLAAENLRKEAQARGVETNRLVFAQRMKVDEHLARHRLADLFIDTLPYNAHTTASDALWAGLPVLTCMGKSFAARVAASLLNTIGLPELIADTQEEYEAKAIELANNPALLAGIKVKLERDRTTSPLFNGSLFAKHIETAYSAMFDCYCAGLEPTHILIK